MNAAIENGVALLRTKWPQAHAVEGEHGTAIFVPTVMLPDCYEQNVCTVVFVAPCGFPSNPPQNFYTDVEVELISHRDNHFIHGLDGKYPRKTVRWTPEFTYEMYGHEWTGGGSAFKPWNRYWPQWDRLMFWPLRLQAWNPNRDSIFTYMNVIRTRFLYDISPESKKIREDREGK